MTVRFNSVMSLLTTGCIYFMLGTSPCCLGLPNRHGQDLHNAHRVSDVRWKEIQTNKMSVPDPSPAEVQINTAKFKKNKT